MRYSREDILNEFLYNSLLIEKSKMNESDLANVRFGQKSSDILVEVLKKLISSYTQGNSEQKITRDMNVIIEKMLKDDY